MLNTKEEALNNTERILLKSRNFEINITNVQSEYVNIRFLIHEQVNISTDCVYESKLCRIL